MCNCGNKRAVEFVVMTADGKTKTVQSEQEARTLTRINGGSYQKKTK